MACSALPLEIAENNLTRCYYIALHCRQCGEIRVATEEAPSDDRYRCPLCQALCHSCLLGEGGTLRPLPFWDRPQNSYSLADTVRRFWLVQKAGRLEA